jgi:arabinan endo-1,5-alpha-L-arabinosidase
MRLAIFLACTPLVAACMVGDADDPSDEDGDAAAADESGPYDPVDHPDDGDVPADDGGAIYATLALKNPILENCADPGVMRDGMTWYMTCTGGGGGNHYPIYSSTDLQHWTHVSSVFPAGDAPTWGSGNWWAPELHHAPGGFAVYFSALSGATNAVGVGTSATVLNQNGYKDRGSPLVKRTVSVIDAHMFIAPDHRQWLYFKLEGKPDTIWVHELTADGKSLTPGPSTRAFGASFTWEHDVVEAPWVMHIAGWYYMFYSGGAYCNSTYAVGVARSKSPNGPWEKRSQPILKSGVHWVGPGHNSVTYGPDHHPYIVYHAYRVSEGTPRCAPAPGQPDNNARHVLANRIVVENGWPRVLAHL